MLIRFVASNFLSFGEEVEFSMLSGNFKTHKSHIYDLGKISVLKSAAIYGSNGAGKSNLVKALDFFKGIVTDGSINKTLNSKKFKLDETISKQPMTFEIEFFTENKVYAYGIALQNTVIIEEWLVESGIESKDKPIFQRTTSNNGKVNIEIAPRFLKSQKSKLLVELMEENLLKANEFLISKSENLKIKDITNANNWIEEQLTIIYPNSKFAGLAEMLIRSDRFKKFANQTLCSFDTGIHELKTEVVEIEKYFGKDDEDLKKEIVDELKDKKNIHVIIPAESGTIVAMKEGEKFVVKKVISQHLNGIGKPTDFDLNEESDGTQRLLDFIPAFDIILRTNATVIVDEIDQSIHPALLKALIKKIMSEDSKGQIIFTTHESNLLDLNIFRQDEIWFIEKEHNTGQSKIYSLSSFKPRYDLDISKGYLKGRFGAIPFLANLEELKWNGNEEEEGV